MSYMDIYDNYISYVSHTCFCLFIEEQYFIFKM